MESENTIYEATLTAASNSVKFLYMAGFATESEYTHISERIRNYTDRHTEISAMNKQ